MPISRAEAHAVTQAFVNDYPVAYKLGYRFGEDLTELYGANAHEVPQGMKGGYIPKETYHQGRTFQGRVDVPLCNVTDASDLLATLRHEVLGHYGANTFAPADKRALLDGLMVAHSEPSIKPLWDNINQRYAGQSADIRAEEVFALVCEGIEPGHHRGVPQVLEKGQQSFTETCIARVRPMHAEDLHNIVCMVAQGMHDRTRTQQNFPTFNSQFRKDEMAEKKPFHEVVAEKLIEQLKQGTAPWQKPWDAGVPNAFVPMNPTTGKRYRGINAIQLMSQGHDDQRWVTYKQAAAMGAQVRKGEKGTPIQYWKFEDEQQKRDDSGKPIKDGQGNPVMERVKLERPRVFFATVFNAEQIDGMPPPQPRQEQEWNAVDRAEQILKASGAVIRHGQEDRAFYRSATDSIHLPDKVQFPTADNYYATALHELGHWTGHGSRLDRDLSHPYGSMGYAKEELRAEIASMILGDELGIGHDPGQHVAYVGSWIKALQDDPMEIFRAAADAEKIQGFVMAFEQQQVQEQTAAQAVEAPQISAADQSVVAALKAVRKAPNDEQKAQAEQALHQASTEAFGFALTSNWTGKARIGGEDAQGRYVDFVGLMEGDQVDRISVHAAQSDDGYQHLATFAAGREGEGLREALELEERLSVVNAYSIDNQLWREEAFASIAMQKVDNQAEYNHEQTLAAHAVWKAAERRAVENTPIHMTDEALTQRHEEQEAVQQSYINRGDYDGAAVHRAEVLGELRDEVEARRKANQPDENAMIQTQQTKRIEQASLERVLDVVTRGSDVGLDKYELNQVRSAILIAADARTISPQSFIDSVKDSFEVNMPADWNGRVLVQGNAQREGVVEPASSLGVQPEFFSVYAQQEDGAHRWIADFQEEADALDMAARLHMIDAINEQNPHEQAAKLAQLYESAIRRDPDSTDEQISAAKEARKDAEGIAMLNDADMQRRIAEIESQQEAPQTAQAISPSQLKAEAQATKAQTPSQLRAEAEAQQKTYIDVPFKQKNEAKELGAKWDRNEQSWYVPAGVDAAPFAKWAQGAATAAAEAPQATPAAQATQSQAQAPKEAQKREYLAVPYGERVAAKAAGAEWDKVAKSWYVGQKGDMQKLARWKPDNVPNQQGPAMTPREEFAEALRSIGCVVTGKHPIMDGGKHRISVEGETFSQKSGAGFYVGHLDGHPAGYMKNNATGVDMKWKSKGYSLDPEEKARLAAEAATKLQEREVEQAQTHEKTSQRVTRQAGDLVPVVEQTPYMKAKGIEPHAGLLTDQEGQKTFIPVSDVNGKQWSMQYIQETGVKRYAKDSRKDGCFHVVGGMDALAKAPALVISEGYATAASISQSVGFATVAAFDAGNLPAVAKALHEKYPDKPVVIAGDNDRHTELSQGVNPGKTKALEAAKLTQGTAIFPTFAPGENTYPPELPPVTPELYRKHAQVGNVLDDKQLAALAHMKGMNDFNDLANKSVLGREGVDRQVLSAVSSAIEKHQARIEQQTRIQRLDATPQEKQRRSAKIG